LRIESRVQTLREIKMSLYDERLTVDKLGVIPIVSLLGGAAQHRRNNPVR